MTPTPDPATSVILCDICLWYANRTEATHIGTAHSKRTYFACTLHATLNPDGWVGVEPLSAAMVAYIIKHPNQYRRTTCLKTHLDHAPLPS